MIRDHRHLALALLVMAFCIKATIPTGFMVSASSDTVLTVKICSDATGNIEHARIVVPRKERSGEHREGANKGEHCAFAGLAKVAVGGADACLLALAIAYTLMLGLAPLRRLSFQEYARIRPPLRGPPAAA
ncbi:hypothetical protein E3U23_02515 [Erythrobacter litoralis]|nr:hypothetical protein [Erythrobacter litoralis]